MNLQVHFEISKPNTLFLQGSFRNLKAQYNESLTTIYNIIKVIL